MITPTERMPPPLGGCSIVVHQIQPVDDPRWVEFLAKSPRSSVFHTPEWLKALNLTYGYEPLVFTTSPPGEPLTNGVPVCKIDSWATGRRLVSLPFSDHCEPLVDRTEELQSIFSRLESQVRSGDLSYVEMRAPRALEAVSALSESRQSYCCHALDLRPDLKILFDNCHKDSTQRKVRRAEREKLTCESGRSDELLETFCRLYVLTRRRHCVPPQPRAWFRNLVLCCGERLNISVASQNGRAVAAVLTLRHKNVLVYKYGCSDARYNNLGGNHLLFWKMIEEGKAAGLEWLDLGRTDLGNTGLITFKSRWGAIPSVLTYSRFAVSATSSVHYRSGPEDWKERFAKRVVGHLPGEALYVLGRIVYRHIG